MNRFLKYVGFTIVGLFILSYLGFLFVLPNIVDLNKFKPDIQKITEEQSGLKVNFENVKIITTPLLGAGIKADNISVKLPDNSLLFSADNFKTRISLPSIFLLTVKVSCLEINKPFVNLEIVNNENFKVVKLVEDILNQGKEQKLEEGQPVEQTKEPMFNPAWIRIKAPCIRLNNYKILVNDLKSKHYLDLHGEELTLGYFNGKSAKVKTNAELYSDTNKNITANMNIDTFLPEFGTKLDEEDDPAERVEIPFVNPVTMYRNYDLKANLDTKLRIRNHNENLTSYGHFDIDNISLKVGNIKLPESYFRAKTFGSNVNLDTNIYAAQNQNIQLLGKLNYSKHPKLDMYIKTADIKFNDLVLLTRAFMDSLHIYNELADVRAEGSLKADCYIKTNFKKLTSSGSINVNNGGISVKNFGKVLSKANICIKLDNNVLDVRNSGLLVGNSPINIDGKIDEKSVADINIKADSIPLPVLFNAFAPKEIRNAYNFKSGNASLDMGLKGKLKNAVAGAKFGIDNLNISDKSINITNKNLNGEIFVQNNDLAGKINNSDFVIYIPQTKSKLAVPKFHTEIADKNITVAENSILFNDKSKLNYTASIIDYTKLKSLSAILYGNIQTDDLIKFIGNEFKPFIHSQGTLPVKVTLDGNKHKQTLFAQTLSDKSNFITPVDFAELQGKDISLQSVVDFKSNRIKVKKTGLFTRTTTVDKKGNEVITLEEIFGIDGTIAGDMINLIKITMPKALNGNIYVFPQSKFNVSGKAFVFGKTSAPRLRGGFDIANLSIPELMLNLRKAELDLQGRQAAINLSDLLLNGSDLQIKSTIDLAPAAHVNIKRADISSRFFNADKVIAVSDKAMKYVPQSTGTAQQGQTADIPVVIQNGSIDFTRILSGNIDIKNTHSQMAMRRNTLFLNNLRTNIFSGRVNGNISVNLITTLLNINVRGQGINVEKALLDAAGMKDTLSGTANFNAKLSLEGMDLETQMKSLKGNVDFTVKDGQFGPFGKIENLIIAENIRESQFFQTALGGIISGLTTIDTTHFSDLSGKLSFNDGICHIDPITSLGNILSLHIFGDFDIMRNYADMKVRARMASLISNLLGPIGAINPANLLNSAASLNVVTAKAFSIFCEMIPEDEMNIIPSFSNSYVDKAATKFQLGVRGDVAKPLTLIKSFKWLATETEYQNAVDYVNSIPDPTEGSGAETIEQAIAERKALEAEKKTVTYKVKHLFQKED